MNEFRRQLELGGLLTADAGTLERPLPVHVAGIPAQIDLDGDRLVWNWFDPKQAVPSYSEPEEWRGCLDLFIRLADASEEQILRFARHWGVLMLCEHGLPATHNPVPFPLAEAGEVTWCYPLGYPGRCYEPLAAWRVYAGVAKALLSIAASLHRGQVGKPGEWQTAYEGSEPGAPWWSQGIVVDRLMLSQRIQAWLRAASVRPWFHWSTGAETPSITLEAGGLFGVLATQLAFAVARADGLAMCAACGSPFNPTRRPAAGRRSFCRSCGRRAANRLATRKWRASKPDQGQSDPGRLRR